MEKVQMKIATLFSGIGSPEKAFRMLGIDYDLAYFGEIDTHAVKSYCAIHNESESKNIGDITKVDIDKLPKDLDWLIGGSPCQDFSLAGKRAGGNIDSGTRSSLMWNFVEIIRETQPKAVLWENVPGALTTDNKANYDKFINVLVQEGYKISAFTLNGKYFGVPQNRQRIFVLASKTHTIQAPKGYDCGIRLKDVLESNVDEKYYLSDKQINAIKTSNFNTSAANKDVSNAVRCGGRGSLDRHTWDLVAAEPSIIELAKLKPHRHSSTANSILSENGLCPTIDTMSGGQREPKIAEPIIYDAFNKTVDKTGISPTITTRPEGFKTAILPIQNYRIRKLTPKECWRLMGFSDKDFYAAQSAGVSNSQLYKQAGNSIVVQVLMAIFGEYYGIDWKPLVYGKWHKTGQEQFADLPIMEGV